jgi:hypothetical protein
MPRTPRQPHHTGALTNISREPGAWMTVLVRRGQRYSDYFPDAVWGGRNKALLATQRFRDEMLLRLGPDTRVRRTTARGVGSRTGVVGVCLEHHIVGGRRYERYVAGWVGEDGHVHRRRFFVKRYGRKQALALAIEAREAGVARTHAAQQARQREEAGRRLRAAPPLPRRVKDPLSRKIIDTARRRTRGR